MNIYEPTFVKKLFNQMSSSYERMNVFTSFGFSILWRKQFINKLQKTDDKIKVLDLLSGMGENWTYLLKKYPQAEFVALDFSEQNTEKSQVKNEKKLGNRFKILKQDFLNNNLENNEFDKVTCAFGLKTFNASQMHVVAQNLSKILKVGGEFSFVEISKPKNQLLYHLYSFYLGKIIPILGKIFLGNPDDYRLLWTYTEKFENSQQVLEIFRKHNLSVRYESYFFGCATGLTGKKCENS